jgi:prepilin peptidase CpaA
MRYFPDPVTGWMFLAGLASVLAIASYTDERTMKVPKWLTLPALAVGLLLSCLRGGWLAAHGMPVWLFEAPGVLQGAFDGLLFALAGFAVGFVLFFCLWLLGFCGGGDVKLFAALGTWLGPYLVLCTLLVSLGLLSVCLAIVLGWRLVRGRKLALPPREQLRGKGKAALRSPVVVRFSVVAALATMLVVFWSFRYDLGLMPPRPAVYSLEVPAHGR